jgi:hypothetical protein
LDDLDYISVDNRRKLSVAEATSQNVSKSVDKYLDSIMPRNLKGQEDKLWVFATTLIQKHRLTTMFTSKGHNLTRTVRWVILSHAILVSFMIDTLFFGIFYPDDATCSVFETKASCLALPSKISSDTTMCEWDRENKVCMLRPPPESTTFMLLIALICVIIALPLDAFVEFIVVEFGAKRPRIEHLNARPDAWLGSGMNIYSQTASKGTYVHM